MLPSDCAMLPGDCAMLPGDCAMLPGDCAQITTECKPDLFLRKSGLAITSSILVSAVALPGQASKALSGNIVRQVDPRKLRGLQSCHKPKTKNHHCLSLRNIAPTNTEQCNMHPTISHWFESLSSTVAHTEAPLPALADSAATICSTGLGGKGRGKTRRIRTALCAEWASASASASASLGRLAIGMCRIDAFRPAEKC